MNATNDLKILIVEDEETLRHAVTKMLEKRGFSVIEACGGRAAIELLRGGGAHIGVVLLDVRLPDIGGRDVFAIICKIDPAIKVILTTASGGREIPEAPGVERQPWGYLRKPYQIDHLADLLTDALAA
jgi:two-component system, cell cycle sensor histidine kinase and response regulator CckA